MDRSGAAVGQAAAGKNGAAAGKNGAAAGKNGAAAAVSEALRPEKAGHGRKTVKITIWGIVQGVGFRPFVAKLAARMGLTGSVCNTGGLVEIRLRESPERIDAFVAALQAEKPLPAEIVHLRVEEVSGRGPAEAKTIPEPPGERPASDGKSSARADVEVQRDGEFIILHSQEGDGRAALLPADLALCPDCLAEMQNPNNPRYLHPFISCMACGPRYTIIDRIPYDRENTSMVEFPMCDFCESQYTSREDRRYHAQTISCHHCGPVLNYRLAAGEPGMAAAGLAVGVIGEELPEEVVAGTVLPITMAARLLRQGRIVAFKSVGGYNLLCDPFNGQAVAALRRLKGREEKPFAVMFRDVEQIREYCFTDGTEERLLASSARPIVLLRKREERFCFDTCRTSRYVGAFLPSMGAQWLLLNQCGPLIVTSANLSERPIIKDDEEMFGFMESAADIAGVFYNRRKIRVSVDDSVVRVVDDQPQMIRRSKGYAPVPLYVRQAEELGEDAMVFAAGGDLKSAFCLSKGPFAYMSQFFGDLDSVETAAIYEENVQRMAALFRVRPGLVVCDLHPRYRSRGFAEEYRAEADSPQPQSQPLPEVQSQPLPLLEVQHHHAHVASVMAEHGLTGPITGVSFDGTGYGTDGTIWGGEFLVCRGGSFRRAAHLEYVKMIGGDASMKDGAKSALCYLHHYGLAKPAGAAASAQTAENSPLPPAEENSSLPPAEENSPLPPAADNSPPSPAEAAVIKAALDSGVNAIESSSMGRLFDAVASLTGIHHRNRYEGECAIMLENAAAEALEQEIPPLPLHFALSQTPIRLSARPVFERILAEPLGPAAQKAAALGFHYAVAEAITEVCLAIQKDGGPGQVALTGGVFQNKILMERSLKLLRQAGLQPYYNISVSPGDGGIALGQALLGMEYLKEQEERKSPAAAASAAAESATSAAAAAGKE